MKAMVKVRKIKFAPASHWSAQLFGPTLERLAPEAHKLLKGLRLAVMLWAVASFIFILGLLALIIYFAIHALR